MAPKIIYLDQNKWIDLSHAAQNTQRGQDYIDLLQSLKKSVEEGRVVLPLSGAHFIETRKIANPKRRHALATVMAELSRGYTLAPSYELVRKQITALCDSLFSEGPIQWPQVIGRNVAFAFGMDQGIADNLGTSQIIADIVLSISSTPAGLMQLLCGDQKESKQHDLSKYGLDYAQRVNRARMNARSESRDLRVRAYLAAWSYAESCVTGVR